MEKAITGLISPPVVSIIEKVRYCLYARKSSEDSSEKQALSVDSQVKEMLAIAEREDLEVVDIRRESHSAKASGQRPVFNELIRDLNTGRYTGILTWAPDRLSRNAGDLGTLVDLMDEKKLHQIRTYGQSFQNSPNEKFLLMILCSQAKLENDNKSINVKRGLRTRCEMGLWPAPAPMGYLNEMKTDRKGYVYIDPERGHIIKKMFEKVAYEKWSGRKLFHWLKFEMNFKTTKGNRGLTLSNIYIILQNHFYYGTFEFPKDSGVWYKGVHEPIITKELFDSVQERLKGQTLVVTNKEFAFTKLIVCGLCGSGICADEKFKSLKDGSFSRHCYYGCTKARDKNCKCGYLREEDLIAQLSSLMDTINLDEIGIQEKIKVEISRFKKFQKSILGIKENVEIGEIDIRNYVKFILKEGTILEKREILSNFTGKISLNNKVITII